MYLNQTEHPLSCNLSPDLASQKRMESLKELIQLEQTRVNLTGSLQGVLDKIQRLQTDLVHSAQITPQQFGTHASPQGTKGNPSPQPGFRRRMRRGELRNQIVDYLKAAGSKGARVREIADALGMKPVNIHSWFHTAAQRLPQLKRFGPGLYKLESDFKAAEIETPTGPKKRRARAGRQTARSKRGEVSKRILEVLENAAPGGIKVAEIAEKVGANYRNVHVWLSSIGKRNPRIIRAGRGLYRMTREQNQPTAVLKSANDNR